MGCCRRRHTCTGLRYPGTLTHRCDILEELVGVTEACNSYHRSTGCQCPRHQLGILHPHVGTQHPPITGDRAQDYGCVKCLHAQASSLTPSSRLRFLDWTFLLPLVFPCSEAQCGRT